jgi:hypothetical protein
LIFELISFERYALDSNDVNTEAEEFPLLRSVTGKRLVKAGWEGVVYAVVIYKLWRLAIASQFLVVIKCGD